MPRKRPPWGERPIKAEIDGYLLAAKYAEITQSAACGQVAGENILATPAPRGYFRLYSELRSAIKNALSRENPEFCTMMVRLTRLELAQP